MMEGKKYQEDAIKILTEIKSNLQQKNQKKPLATIDKAFQFAKLHHGDQKRKSGEPFYLHPLNVALIVSKMNLDIDTVVAAILHDVVEDTDVTLDILEKEFGQVVRNLVDGVTKLSKYKFRSHEQAQAENFRKMLVAMSDDIRVILIKLADRLHNMRTLQYMPREKQIRIAKETEDIYAPLAHRLGIAWLKAELEDLVLKYTQPEVYNYLREKLEQYEKEKESYVREVVEIIKNALLDYQLDAKVYGRFKHLYSIARKMKIRNVPFEEIYDLIAFRIIVSDVKECYQTLGIIHSFWKPVPGRFKDYIAMPKPNNYQSLHTTVIGPYGRRIEIQIRTQAMHEIAEYGIAAHWMYKENIQLRDFKKVKWIQELVELQKDLPNPEDFLETLKLDLFANEVFVFTPKGDVIELPVGSTPVDFAYAIHTEIGNTITASKVNGKIVPLKYKLKSGDVVEIITSKNQTPKKDWLKFVKTGRAKSKIRQFLRQEEREKAYQLGLDILEKAFKKLSRDYTKYLNDKLFKKFRVKDKNEFILNVGYGRILISNVLAFLFPDKVVLQHKEESKKEKLKKIIDKVIKRRKKYHSAVKVSGQDDILVNFAKCCNPVHGEPIIGFITRGHGITIHAKDCPVVQSLPKERLIDVEWNDVANDFRVATLRIVSENTPGLLHKMSKVFYENGANVVGAQIKTDSLGRAVSIFSIEVQDIDHLNNIIQKIRHLSGIIGVERLKKTQ